MFRAVNPTPHVAGGHTDTPSGFEMSQTRWEYPMILEQPMEEERKKKYIFRIKIKMQIFLFL